MMDKENLMPEQEPQPDIYDREEKCIKAIRTMRKAVFMRLFLTAVILWAILRFPMPLLARGLMAFVILINIAGSLPLWQEWRRQKALLRELIAQEEE